MPRDFNFAQLKMIEEALTKEHSRQTELPGVPGDRHDPLTVKWNKLRGLLALVRMYIESYDHSVD